MHRAAGSYLKRHGQQDFRIAQSAVADVHDGKTTPIDGRGTAGMTPERVE
ncbi:hypothetical protein BDI4_210004 [Burkholderia diffusa]|nr:hypothetical protein BDI4_210004 [Burkholderia diffusa]